VQSHALSFFYLSSPDFLLGMDADPAKRNIIGVLQANPELARGGIRLRQFGQQVIELLGGKRIHPAWVVPGGVSEPLDPAKREKILKDIPEVLPIALKALKWFQGEVGRFTEEIDHFANFDTLFMAPVGEGGTLEHYHGQHGQLRMIDSRGNIVAIHIVADQYPDFIGEAVEPYTYLKFPYYKPLGYPAGIYRVGPLARLNVATRAGTPHADDAMREWKKMGVVSSSFHFHLARLIEIVYGIERIEQLLNDEDILDKHVRATAGVNNLEGIGISEAPRGTLIHHYRVNEHGQMEWANLIIATGHNNLAMNQGVTQVAKHFVKGQQITEGMLNRVEAVIRCYDPCLSCSTHALGEMPLEVELVDPTGNVVDQVRR
jgi:NAD-reducing hydrogenase large subunit